jgi:hypothetical protein
MTMRLCLTEQPIRVAFGDINDPPAVQPLYLATPLAGVTSLEVAWTVYQLSAAADFDLQLYTGEDATSENGWYVAAQIQGVSAIGVQKFSLTSGFLSYLRWRIVKTAYPSSIYFHVAGTAQCLVQAECNGPTAGAASQYRPPRPKACRCVEPRWQILRAGDREG